MSLSDQEKWDAIHANSPEYDKVSPVVMAREHFFPRTGKALDVAGGSGRHALWLAQRGMEVTLVDISTVALQRARHDAADIDVSLNTCRLDLQIQEIPAGPWDLILTVLFYQPSLFSQCINELADGGRLIVIQPTDDNLLRHKKPPKRFLTNPAELLELVKPLRVVHFEADWLEAGRHDAFLVAEKY